MNQSEKWYDDGKYQREERREGYWKKEKEKQTLNATSINQTISRLSANGGYTHLQTCRLSKTHVQAINTPAV